MKLIHKIVMWASIVLIGFGFIIARGFSTNVGESEVGNTLFLSGIALASIGALFLFIIIALVIRDKKKLTNQKESDFLMNSKVYQIDAKDCQVKTVGYEVDEYNLKNRDVETVKKEKVVISYTTDRFGESRTFYSEGINRDLKSVEIRLELGVEVSLTIHKDRPEEYKLEALFDS